MQTARTSQIKRFKKTKIITNAEMSSKQVRELCPLEKQTKSLLTSATAQMGLTARSYFKIIKLARTIADLNEEQDIATHHIAEALQYRPQEQVI